MAIEFNCPHCHHPYRLKDEFAGKRATCKNPDCRQQITIPQPLFYSDDAPKPTAAELEAAALSALYGEVEKETGGAGENPAAPTAPAGKVIPMTCQFCAHQWTEPWAKAGKNTLCPNPECRQRVRVPEPKEDVPLDWRQQRSKLPSGAKQHFDKLEGVQSAGDARIVSGDSLRKADATGEEIEPRPLKQKVLFGLVAVGLLGGLGFGGCYLANRNRTSTDDQLMADALKEFAGVAKELPPTEQGLYSALLHAADAEYALRQDDKDKLKQAHVAFVKALTDVRQPAPSGQVKNAVAAELALLAVAFGGTDDQVKAQTRYRWVPETDARVLRATERPRTVHEELGKALPAVQGGADFDFRIGVARRLTREFVKKGQAGFAADIVPLSLFGDAERDEARAVVALEIYRADRGAEAPRKIADELKAKLAAELAAKAVKGSPYPASAQTLFLVANVEKAPQLAPPPGATGTVGESTRIAYAGKLLLEGDSGEALKLALRPGSPEHQLKALLLCAEWTEKAKLAPAIEAAHKLIADNRAKHSFSQSQIFRLSQIAAATPGRADDATKFADFLADEGLKAWAKGDAVRQRSVANPEEKAEETWVEVPAAPDKLKAGHAWGRFWVARQNAKLSGNRNDEKKATALWSPAPIHPFASAGIALGLQDR